MSSTKRSGLLLKARKCLWGESQNDMCGVDIEEFWEEGQEIPYIYPVSDVRVKELKPELFSDDMTNKEVAFVSEFFQKWKQERNAKETFISIFLKWDKDEDKISLCGELNNDFFADLKKILVNPKIQLDYELKLFVFEPLHLMDYECYWEMEGKAVFPKRGNSIVIKEEVDLILPSDGDVDYFELIFNLELSWEKTTATLNVTQPFNLFECESTKDFTIVARDGEVRCHKFVLASCNPVFANLVGGNMKEAVEGKAEIDDMSLEGVTLLLQFFYGVNLMKMHVTCELALELFDASQKYLVEPLGKAVEEMVMEQNDIWFTPGVTLRMYYFVKNLGSMEKLKRHLLRVMARMAPEIKRTEEFKEMDSMDQLGLLTAMLNC